MNDLIHWLAALLESGELTIEIRVKRDKQAAGRKLSRLKTE